MNGYITEIRISLHYKDETGENQFVSKSAMNFESAQEAIGKLESYAKRNEIRIPMPEVDYPVSN